MRNKIGTLLMVLGALMLAGAIGLLLHNENEQQRAAAASAEAIPKVVQAIQERAGTQPETIPAYVPEAQKTMSMVEIDGYHYIGFLGLPAIGLELPVMGDWTYPQLQIAPCRYTGSTYTDDLVIMAHNYEKHFGKLSKLVYGDPITFTDMDGQTTAYKVVAKDILDPTAVEEMTAGDYDLTLFTCTYGGENRVTIRCDRAAGD